MHRIEQFLQPSLPEGFYWFNEPSKYRLGNGLEIFTDERTDFWQRTHYGFQRDDGHCLLTKQSGDFSLTTRVEFEPREKYDQCGLIVRIDSQNWIKVSTEYESEHESRLGSVVTNLGYSDWATQDVPSDRRTMWYRISKRGSDYLLENSLDGQTWLQMRITHLHQQAEHYEIGVYACSPIGTDFRCVFKTLEIADNQWLGLPEAGE
jgi:regulation of enolase protein 1 (concanavalin A-like superfamily)